MKKDPLFEKCLAGVPKEIMEEVSINIDIANRIYDLLKKKKMTQRDFAALMGKRESEISRWLTGSHGFTTTTLSKISAVLGEPIVEVYGKHDSQYVYIDIHKYFACKDIADIMTNIYSSKEETYNMAYQN